MVQCQSKQDWRDLKNSQFSDIDWTDRQASNSILLFFASYKEGRADAVPTTRNYTPDSPDLDERRGQPLRSAMARSRPGGTALMITVTSAPSKFNCRATNWASYTSTKGARCQLSFFNEQTKHTAWHPALFPELMVAESIGALNFSFNSIIKVAKPVALTSCDVRNTAYNQHAR